jgi:hypothetical protein
VSVNVHPSAGHSKLRESQPGKTATRLGTWSRCAGRAPRGWRRAQLTVSDLAALTVLGAAAVLTGGSAYLGMADACPANPRRGARGRSGRPGTCGSCSTGPDPAYLAGGRPGRAGWGRSRSCPCPRRPTREPTAGGRHVASDLRDRALPAADRHGRHGEPVIDPEAAQHPGPARGRAGKRGFAAGCPGTSHRGDGRRLAAPAAVLPAVPVSAGREHLSDRGGCPVSRMAPAAWLMMLSTAAGCEIIERCEAPTSTMWASARRAMNSCSAGGMTLSWVPTRSQEGIVFQAGAAESAASALRVTGLWVDARTAPSAAGRSLAKHRAKPGKEGPAATFTYRSSSFAGAPG